MKKANEQNYEHDENHLSKATQNKLRNATTMPCLFDLYQRNSQTSAASVKNGYEMPQCEDRVAENLFLDKKSAVSPFPEYLKFLKIKEIL